MEKDTPIAPKTGEISELRKRVPHVLPAGSTGEFLQRRLGEPKNQQAGEGSLSLAQWEAQWQQFLRTVENPPSGWGTPPLPEKPSPWEDAKSFLSSFEQVAEACRWPQEEWATRLLPALSGEAKWTFNNLDVRDREDYGEVKAAILRSEALSQEKQRQQFRGFCFQETEGPRGAYRRLWEMCCGWLRVEKHSKEEILELLILEQLLNILPLEIQSHVRESGPESCSQAVALAEEFLLRQEKQVPLEEAAGSISEAGRDPSESEWRHLLINIKEEEGGESSPLAGSADEIIGEFQESSSETAEEEDSEGNYRDPGGIKRKEGADTDQRRDRHIPFQGGGFHEIPVQEERPTEDFSSNQRFHCREKENESLSVGKTLIQKRNIFSQEQIHSGQKPYDYLECRKIFSRQAALTSHQSYAHFPKHNRKKAYKCFQCGKTFSQKYHLQRHQRTHTGEKPFECSECGKKFTQNYHLQRHQRTHTVEKPFLFSECGKSFQWNSHLQQHERTHIGKKPFKCSECGKSFQWNGYLQQHQRTHTGKKPFKCSECGKSFQWNGHLKQHQRIHTGERPFECSGCGKKFKQSGHLQKHLRTHMV